MIDEKSAENGRETGSSKSERMGHNENGASGYCASEAARCDIWEALPLQHRVAQECGKGRLL